MDLYLIALSGSLVNMQVSIAEWVYNLTGRGSYGYSGILQMMVVKEVGSGELEG